MKHALTVLALALLLIISLGSSAWTGILPWEDLNKPGGIGDGGLEDGDHPWGGDRYTGDTGDKGDDKLSRPSNLTGYFAVDLLIERFIKYIKREDDRVLFSRYGRISQSRGIDRPECTSPSVSSRIGKWEVER